MTSGAAAGAPARDLGVDVVRCVALLAMFVAHCAPTLGPGAVLMVADYLTMPLFALLVGVGSELAEQRARTGGGRGRWARSVLVRSAVLIALGLALAEAGAAVLIVLAHLGVLSLVMALGCRLPAVGVGAVGLLAWAVSPVLNAGLTPATYPLSWVERLQDLLLTGHSYRVSTMIVYACAGALLIRLAPSLRSRPIGGVTGAGLLLAAAVLLLAGRRGLLDLAPYSGTHVEIGVNLLLTIGTFLLVGWLVSLLPVVLVRLVAWAGAMTLTVYSLHVLYLAAYVRVLHPGRSDDSWANVLLLTAGSLALAGLWHLIARRPPWSRGPVEGAVAAVVRA